jgi:hypothetical protein
MQCITDLILFPSGYRVMIEESAVCNIISSVPTVSQVGLPTILISLAMADSKSLSTLFLEVIICSKNKRVFIRELNYLTLQIIFDPWWTYMNLDSWRPIALNNCGHALSW